MHAKAYSLIPTPTPCRDRLSAADDTICSSRAPRAARARDAGGERASIGARRSVAPPPSGFGARKSRYEWVAPLSAADANRRREVGCESALGRRRRRGRRAAGRRAELGRNVKAVAFGRHALKRGGRRVGVADDAAAERRRAAAVRGAAAEVANALAAAARGGLDDDGGAVEEADRALVEAGGQAGRAGARRPRRRHDGRAASLRMSPVDSSRLSFGGLRFGGLLAAAAASSSSSSSGRKGTTCTERRQPQHSAAALSGRRRTQKKRRTPAARAWPPHMPSPAARRRRRRRRRHRPAAATATRARRRKAATAPAAAGAAATASARWTPRRRRRRRRWSRTACAAAAAAEWRCDGGGGEGGGGGARGGGAGGEGGGGAGVSDTQQPAQLSQDSTRSSHSQSPVVEAGSAVHRRGELRPVRAGDAAAGGAGHRSRGRAQPSVAKAKIAQPLGQNLNSTVSDPRRHVPMPGRDARPLPRPRVPPGARSAPSLAPDGRRPDDALHGRIETTNTRR